MHMARHVSFIAALALGFIAGTGAARAAEGYRVYVTNERSGDVTVIDGATLKVTATLPVGERPRGIHPGPDGRTVYVATSGTPIEGPPQRDASGNPVFNRDKDDDDEDKADK